MTSYYLTLFFGTFALEDAALLSGLGLAEAGKVTWIGSFLAVFLGISVGDVGVYWLGRWSRNISWLQRRPWIQTRLKKADQLVTADTLTMGIFISRFLPGTRVIMYLFAGAMKFSAFKFTLVTTLSVFLWVGVVFIMGQKILELLKNNLILAIILIAGGLWFISKVVFLIQNKHERTLFFHSWRKWTHFEFWPAWFFYIPLYFYYFYLSVRMRSFLLPFYANPAIYNGGILGEAKWDFLKHLDLSAPTTLPTALLPQGASAIEVEETLNALQITYPFILKPNIGQRGFGVRIIKNIESLKTYLENAHFELIVQKLSLYKQEAGLFYIRHPDSDQPLLYSITDKFFPFVVGNGKLTLAELIVADSRSRKTLSVYFSRHKENLDLVIPDKERFFISECGNHCQGAIFKNGQNMITPELTKAVHDIVKNVPHFYFGRLDVRYENPSSLKLGKNFEIVEINGAGAEATHIWDPQTTLFEAYSVLFSQWHHLFTIGYKLKHTPQLKHQLAIKAFLLESVRVFFRKEKLSVSS